MGLTTSGTWWDTKLTWIWCKKIPCAGFDSSHALTESIKCPPLQCDIAPKKHILLLFRHIGALKMAAGRAHRSNAGAKMAGLLDKEVDCLNLRLLKLVQGWNRILVPYISLQGQLLSLLTLPEVKNPCNPCQSLWQRQG